MMSGLSEFARKAANYLVSLVYSPRIQSINFDFLTLCPTPLKNKKMKTWVETYLLISEDNTLLLWADENNFLNASYFQNNIIAHELFEQYQVDPQSLMIMESEEVPPFTLSQIGLQPYTFSIPSTDELRKIKDQAFLKMNIVSDEWYSNLKNHAQRALTNAESVLRCSICFDNFQETGKDAPAMIDSGQFYHARCIQTYFNTIPTNRIATDPQTRQPIQSRTQITYAPGFQTVLLELENSTDTIEQMNQTMEALKNENEKLKRKIKRLQS